MSDLSPLSGEERKSNFGAARSVDGLIADIGRGGPVGRIPPRFIFDWVGDGPMSADHAHVGLFGISVFKTIASQSHFSCRQVVFRLKQGPLL